MRPSTTHELKEWPEYFKEVKGGRKKFELRRNDRDFQVGDQLLLKEWDPKAEFGASGEPVGYTGDEVRVRVDHIMDDAHRFGLDSDWVIMSISLVS